MRGSGLFVAAIAGLVLLAGCSPDAAQKTGADGTAQQAAPLEAAAGTPEVIRLDADESLQMSASVVKLTELDHQGDVSTVKLFGTAAGDPAANGLYTYMAFYVSTADGWRVFKLGDFLDYTVLSDAPGRVDLDIHETTINEKTDEMGSRHRRVIVTWPVGADGAVPETLSVAPAK